jgi:DNA-directed RNA polymerase specialized sigma24 family protein
MSAGSNIVIDHSPEEMNDELVVSAAKSGDANAFVELSERHFKRLLQRTYPEEIRITRNSHDVEDALQDCLLDAFVSP